MDLDAKDIFYISLFLSENLYFIDVGHEKKEERRRKEKELGEGAVMMFKRAAPGLFVWKRNLLLIMCNLLWWKQKEMRDDHNGPFSVRFSSKCFWKY